MIDNTEDIEVKPILPMKYNTIPNTNCFVK